MNSLSLENMRGAGRALRGLSAPLTIEIDHGDVRTKMRHDLRGVGQWDNDEFGLDLTPNVAPWWQEPPIPKGLPRTNPTGARANLEPGEAYRATDAYRPSQPFTPSNDERNLPSSWTQEPLKQLPKRNFNVTFPHGWIPYEDVQAVVGPDTPPRPSGWATAPLLSQEKARAIDAVHPEPWMPDDLQVYDVSGFASLRGAMHGLGQVSVPSSVTTVIAQQAATEAAKAAAAGAGPSDVEKIIAGVVDFGSQAAALYLQKRAIDEQKDLLAKQAAATAAAQAAAAGRPLGTVSQPGGGFPTGAVVVGGGISLALLAAYLLTRKKGGRR